MIRYYKYDIIFTKFVIFRNDYVDNTRTVKLDHIFKMFWDKSNPHGLVFPFKSVLWSYFNYYSEFFNYFKYDYKKYKCTIFNYNFTKSQLKPFAEIVNAFYDTYHPKKNYIDYSKFDEFLIDLDGFGSILRKAFNRLDSLRPRGSPLLKFRVAPSPAAPMKW